MNWQKAFSISMAIFFTALSISIITGIIHLFGDPYENIKYTGQLGLKEAVYLIKTIDALDVPTTVLTAMSSLVTFIGKTVRKPRRKPPT